MSNSAWPQGSAAFTDVQRQLRMIASQISGTVASSKQPQEKQKPDGNKMVCIHFLLLKKLTLNF